jgi:E3 ubiquitin-protein ligase DOA10
MKIKKEISCHIMLSRDEIEQLKQLLLEPERFSEELSRKERKLIEEIIEGFEQEIEKGRRNMIDAVVDETIDIFNGKINQTFPKSTSQQKNQMIELIVEFAEAIQEGSRKYKKEDSDRINNQFFKDIRTRIEK